MSKNTKTQQQPTADQTETEPKPKPVTDDTLDVIVITIMLPPNQAPNDADGCEGGLVPRGNPQCPCGLGGYEGDGGHVIDSLA